tara:strand:+ start:485 stop:805 length:321 start_codon:yes stop_codon:yes gene_type:complete
MTLNKQPKKGREMNKYRVSIWEESGGYVDIEAESLDKAEKDVGELLLVLGFDALMYPNDHHGGQVDRIKYTKQTHGSNEVLSALEMAIIRGRVRNTFGMTLNEQQQ